MIYGRRREIGLGGFPTVPLAEARTLAMANRRAIREGQNPLEEKRRAGAPSRTGLDIADCINRTCPWSGRPVQADSLTRYGDLIVGFWQHGLPRQARRRDPPLQRAAAKSAR